MPEDKKEFEVDGKKYAVRVPTVQEIKEANEMRAKTFNDALSRGDLLRDQLEGELRKRKYGMMIERRSIKPYGEGCWMGSISSKRGVSS